MYNKMSASFIALFICIIAVSCVKEKKEIAPVTLTDKIGAVSLNTIGTEVQVNTVLKTGDKIITGGNSMASILVPKNSAIKIYENTEFIITKKIASGDDRITAAEFKIEKGKTMLVIEKLSKDTVFNVSTPTAVASVRGTSFTVSVDKERNRDKGGSTDVKVLTGTVQVNAKDRPQENRTISDGEMVAVSNNAIIEEKKKIPDQELKELKSEEKEIKTTVLKIQEDKEAKEKEKSAIKQDAPPILKTEAEIRNYYHKLEQVNLDDGSSLVGAVIFQNAGVVRIHTSSGIVQVPTSSIKNILIR